MDKYLQAVSDAAHSVEGLGDDAFAVWKALERIEEDDAEVNTVGLEEALSNLQGLQSSLRYVLSNVQYALDQALQVEAETEEAEDEESDSEEDCSL